MTPALRDLLLLPMLPIGPARKITIYINEDVSSPRGFLHDEIFDFLLRHDIAGASVSEILSGFGSHHRAHTAGAPGAAGWHRPVRIEFIETATRVTELLPALLEMVSDGLVEMHEVVVLKSALREDRAATGGDTVDRKDRG